MSLCCKTKINTPHMYEILEKTTIKSKILPCLSVAKRGYASKKWTSRSHSIHSLQDRKQAVNGRLLRHFHDAVSVGREQHALQSLALAVVSVRVFRTVAHARVYSAIGFVCFSARNLTLWVPFLFTTRPPCRKKSILAKVCFDVKRGLSVNATKWIFI